MEDFINRPLKLQILEKALQLEHGTRIILLQLLRIDKESKSLGHKGAVLSFMSKVDVLNDLGKINDSEYDYFKLFMEIRNIAMHQIEASSWHYILNRLESSRRNKFLKINPRFRDSKSINVEQNEESLYSEIFDSLGNMLQGTLVKALEAFRLEIERETEKEIAVRMQSLYQKSLENIFNSLEKMWKEIEENPENPDWFKNVHSTASIGVRNTIRRAVEEEVQKHKLQFKLP